MNNNRGSVETSDPDYQNLQAERRCEINQSLHREDARDQTVQRIQKIIQDQFSFEIETKEKEVLSINRRVHDTRRQLDRLRACILAGYYGYGGGLRRNNVAQRKAHEKMAQSKQTSRNEVMKWRQSLPANLNEPSATSSLSSKLADHTDEVGISGEHLGTPKDICNNHQGSLVPPTLSALSYPGATTEGESESRFYVKRRVIVGNTSKYILPEHREKNDRSTHKWMVYVRGPKDNGDLQNFISKVWFLLHPSYQPNDLVEVCKPPFQVTRRGWGEFPVRVQLHFVESKNKRVDIIHHLKLDKTYTGLQTLGAETHVDIELDRKNFDSTSLYRESHPPVIKTETSTTTCGPMKKLSGDSRFESGLEFGNHHGNDHSYSVPATKSQSDEDGLKYPTPPISVPGSRCSSPEIGMKDILPKNLNTDAEIKLRHSIAQFPIINAKCNPVLSPYCATSLDQYFRWHIGKRLATEWQRSLAVKKHILTNHPSINLSTKDVMNYCRFHGYTPLRPPVSVEGKVLCKSCGEEQIEVLKNENEEDEVVASTCGHCSTRIPESLSCGNEFLEYLKGCDLSPTPELTSADMDADMSDIDVVSVPKKQSVKPGTLKLLFLPMTEELQWVQETAGEIDVHLQRTSIDGVRTPVITAMLYKACCLLIEDILHKANSFTWKNPLLIPKTNCILPTHIQQAIETIPHCDFLTNKYLGIAKPAMTKD